MNYIVMDMEWNQPWPGSPSSKKLLPVAIRGEIIQIGAVRVTEDQFVTDGGIPIRIQKRIALQFINVAASFHSFFISENAGISNKVPIGIWKYKYSSCFLCLPFRIC